ncbi:MAG: hypothetical protein GF320_13780 [Armatimonadia bacterium]|nr:hypothetical protein [Armatimonadia bacterium]
MKRAPMLCLLGLLGILLAGVLAHAQRPIDDDRRVIDLIDLDTGDRAPLPRGDGTDDEPAWAPDGGRLVFVSDRHGDGEIHDYEVDSGRVRRLTERPGEDRHPAYSADGDHIVYASDAPGELAIYRMGRNGGEPTQLTGLGGPDGHPAWRPDSSTVVFARGRGLFSVDLAELAGTTRDRGGDPRSSDRPGGRRVSDPGDLPAAVRFLRPGGECRDLAWSPDGSLLAFSSERQDRYELYVVTAEGDRLRRITEQEGDAIEPTWHPEGLYLAYTLVTEEGTEVRRVNSDGSRDVPMPWTRPGDSHPAWSPDGATLAVVGEG